MTVFKIREIKGEIRVLGLIVFRPPETPHFEVVGPVFRGKHWLDGVLRTKTTSPEMTEDIVGMIEGSKHHRQIRVILLHRGLLYDGAKIDPSILALELGKPVIAMDWPETPDITETESLRVSRLDGGSVAFGLEKDKAEIVLKTATRNGGLPETLRTARLLKDAIMSRR
ncbi:MAG: hypothetical protein PVJ38_06435 [Candidatus Bathyarchaeota archaeon]|jgi:endonuclease V-like protein UPF0215 family